MARMRERRDAYTVLEGKLEGKRSTVRRSVDGRIILQWIFKKSVGSVDWIDLVQDTVMNLRVP